MTHQRREGRQHAIQTLLSVTGHAAAWFDARGAFGTVIDNLAETAKRCPGQYAAGILDVISAVRGEKTCDR